MTIDNLFTTQIAQGGQGKSLSTGKAAKGLSSQGLQFFDMFLQNTAEALDAAKLKTKDGTLSTSMDALATQNAKEQEIDVTALLAVNEQVEEDIGFMDEASLDEIIALNQKELEGEIIPLEDMEAIAAEIAAEAKAKDISIEDALMIEGELNDKPALFHLQRLAQKLEKLADEENPVLTALNITPEQITALKAKVDDILERVHDGEKVRDVLDDLGTEENAEDFAAILNFIKILSPKSKQNFVIKGQGLGNTGNNFITTPQAPSNDLAARLNNLTIGVNDANFTSLGASDDVPFDDFEATLQKILKGEKGEGFGDIIKDAGKGKAGGLPGTENAANNAQTSKLQGWPFSLSGSLFAPISYSEGAYDELGIPTGMNAQATSLSAMTSMVTQSHSAGQAHPGTQMVAAQIKKMAGSGETKNIRIQLDPPELGRVEIKMSFKDKTVKAIITAEKPETFMMMQRDSQALERALQEAGIDADGSELSFELAQDEQDFNQDGRHDGSRNEARGQDGEEEEVIESTMTWHVDPETGYTRYDILA